jgi:glycosyltransferase involved in cell wall biosynthesis
MNKKKILFVINSLRGGGAEKVLVNLVNSLDKNKYNITVEVLFGDGVNKQFLAPNIQIIRLFKKAPKGFVHLTKLLPAKLLHRLFIKGHYDIEASFLQGVCTRIVGGAPENTPIITWIHNFDYAKRIFRSKSEMKTILSRSYVVACVSKHTGNQVMQSVDSLDNVKVVYNIQDVNSIFAGAKENVPEMQREDVIKLVTTGTLYEIKGYLRLLQSLAQLPNTVHPFHMYFVGDGPQREELEQFVKKNDLGKQVTFFGFDKNPYKYMSKADWFICSSYTEGFSGTVSEATILGIPTLTTRCAGMDEILGENNEYGIIVENSDEALYEGLKQILSQPSIHDEYKQKVQARKDFFDPSVTIKQVEQLIDSL